MAVFLDNGMKSSIQEGQVQGDLLQEADLEGTLLCGHVSLHVHGGARLKEGDASPAPHAIKPTPHH